MSGESSRLRMRSTHTGRFFSKTGIASVLISEPRNIKFQFFKIELKFSEEVRYLPYYRPMKHNNL
jgi:hypothetical protein